VRGRPKQERRKRGQNKGSKVLFATISPEHWLKLHDIAGKRSLGLTLEDLIDATNPIKTEIPFESTRE